MTSYRWRNYVLFINFREWRVWDLVGPSPFLPYEWRLYLGPFCLCEVTNRKPRRLSRQERRYLLRKGFGR